MHVKVDQELCSGYGNCVVAAPEVFELDETTNLAVVLADRPRPGDEEAVHEAQADCPARAILINGAA